MNTIIGRVTKNAEINTLKNDKKVVNFSVATNDSYKNKQGERVEQTTYYNCSYWLSPNVAKILTKGSLVELSGRVSSNAWIGKDGEIKSGLNFHTSNIKRHSSGKDSVETVSEKPSEEHKGNPFAEDENDDLPF
jgi:single-strand DNA-binding protein